MRSSVADKPIERYVSHMEPDAIIPNRVFRGIEPILDYTPCSDHCPQDWSGYTGDWETQPPEPAPCPFRASIRYYGMPYCPEHDPRGRWLRNR